MAQKPRKQPRPLHPLWSLLAAACVVVAYVSQVKVLYAVAGVLGVAYFVQDWRHATWTVDRRVADMEEDLQEEVDGR